MMELSYMSSVFMLPTYGVNYLMEVNLTSSHATPLSLWLWPHFSIHGLFIVTKQKEVARTKD